MLAWFNQHFSQLGYLAVALAMLAEGLTLPCPALIVLLMAGAACAVGKLSFWAAVIIAAGSYSLGSLVPYYIGYNIPRLQNLPWVGRYVESSLQALDQVNALFKRYGEQAVALFRPFWIGNLISYFAGLNRMACYRFFSFTFIGISAWSIAVVFLGQVFSTNLPKAAALVKHYSGIAFLFVILISLLGWRLTKIRHARQGLPAVRD